MSYNSLKKIIISETLCSQFRSLSQRYQQSTRSQSSYSLLWP